VPRKEGDEISFDAQGRPRWGRKAAGILIRRTDSGMFLLVMRSNEVMDPGVLGIPGGRVEPGESEEVAAIQEATEELGPMPPLRFVDRDVYTSGDFSYVTFLALMSGENAEGWKPELNWENDAWIWVDLSDLVGIREIHPNVRRVLEKWSR
jgi:8-oxo-dGTP pyrophosphatase MutT (NUDIX family)